MARPLAIPFLAALAAAHATAQPTSDSAAALRFFGTGVGPPGQQDRVRIPIDDNLGPPTPDASSPCDVGAGGFSIDFWLRGTLADNSAPPGPGAGDREFFDFRWIYGNIVVDRDVYGGTERDWGVSLAGGRVRFGTGRADTAPLDAEHTIEGSVNVLTGAWRHVCIVRDAATGIKSIYVDGALDYASPPSRSRDDISFPDAGAPGQVTPWGPYIVLAAEKHDAGPEFPSFAGFLDEFRVWNIALTPAQIAERFNRVLPPDSPGLVGAYRFEEGSGTTLASTAAVPAPAGLLIAGLPGNGQWVMRSQDPANVAPVTLLSPCPADFNGAGGLSVQDIFDFLAAYFAGDPRADFNASGGTSVQDIFDFLAAYFSGCS